MAKAPLVNKRGEEKFEYPKLVKTAKGKVRVNNADEEAALEDVEVATPKKGWKDK